ncbi:unnamed protein product [Peronospora destructor]|uniref:Polyprotein n=1 Tax=Peronospora destructor TaxID=86335 RepID=A0AAV0TFK9_9STRA|nr:unnamed protein product [Peronospora destructor]
MEAEFVAGSLVASELLGMYELLDEIGIKVEVPMILHIDNQAAIKQTTGEDSSGRAKHIAFYNYHIVRTHIQELRACFVNHKEARYNRVTPPSIRLRQEEEAARKAAESAEVSRSDTVSPSGAPIPQQFVSSLREAICRPPPDSLLDDTPDSSLDSSGNQVTPSEPDTFPTNDVTMSSDEVASTIDADDIDDTGSVQSDFNLEMK